MTRRKKTITSMRIAECVLEGLKQFAAKQNRSVNYYYDKWIKAGIREEADKRGTNSMKNVLPKELLKLMKDEMEE